MTKKPDEPFDPLKCYRKKYTEQQSAINSTHFMSRRRGVRMSEPKFCEKCQAWHVGSTF